MMILLLRLISILEVTKDSVILFDVNESLQLAAIEASIEMHLLLLD